MLHREMMNMRRKEFTEKLGRELILLDGATGSCLRTRGMPVGVCTEQWAFDHPEVISGLQRAYAEAGSDIVYAPTFSANRLGLEMHGLADRLEALNTGLVRLTRAAVGDETLVAGDLTTTGKPLEPIGTMTYQALFDIYREQAAILARAGVDLFIAETMLTIDETACAVEAVRSVCDLPVMCSLTMEADGRLLFGGTAAEAVETLQSVGACAVGLNCSVGPDQLEATVASMAEVAQVPVIAKPNAGLPTIDDKGVAHYSMGPEAFAEAMARLVRAGAGVIGGCCGTDPEYIRLLRKITL